MLRTSACAKGQGKEEPHLLDVVLRKDLCRAGALAAPNFNTDGVPLWHSGTVAQWHLALRATGHCHCSGWLRVCVAIELEFIRYPDGR